MTAERSFTPRRERRPKTPMAFTASKPGCGCVVFARLTGAFGSGPLEKMTKGWTVNKVPVAQAKVVICTC